MNRYFRCLMLSGLLMASTVVIAQPCLPDWNYRVPVLVNNTNGSLTNHQVLVTVNTSELIANAKMQLSGADIRFLNESGSVLAHWIESGTMNTMETRIWVNVDALAASSTSTIYLFYGNSTATDIANGDNTFELFDGFDGSVVNTSKWSACGAGSTSVSNSELTINISGGQDYFLEASSGIASSIIIETGVTSVSQGTAVFGLVNGSNEGYGVAYEVDGQAVALMNKIAHSGCFDLSGIGTAQDAKSASTTAGVWSFGWHSPNNQFFDWPGNTSSRELRSVTDFTLPGTVFPLLGLSGSSSASVAIDWIGARKHVATDPIASLGTEATIVNEVTASASETACSGESLQLFAEALPGAVFSWSGPNLFTSTEQNPTINPASAAASGTYTVTATVPSNCFTVQDQVEVSIDAGTVPGTLSGAATVCSGDNSGTVVLSGNTGDVVRWETSTNGDVPWISINETSTSLPYNNLVTTAHYRAIVKNGTCSEGTSNSVAITIDQNAIPGNVIGGGTVCLGENSGTLRLNDYTGTILRWESKTETETVWTTINTTSDNLTFQDLEETSDFRAIISGGSCGELSSTEERVVVAPLPEVTFSANEVCLGVETPFFNGTQLESGQISSYQWSFDDGNTSILTSPTHEYDQAATFDVRLTATSDQGCVSDTVKQVTVDPLPQVDIFTEDLCLGLVSTFEPSVSIASGGVTRYSWNLGDGTETRLFNDNSVAHTFDSPGEYRVSLEARSVERCIDSAVVNVTVYPRAALDFSVPPVFEGESSAFQNNSTIVDGSLVYDWQFGDGATSSVESPTYTYQEAGLYNVSLTTTTSIGNCIDTLSQQYEVKAQVLADFNFENTCRDIPAQFTNASISLEGELSYQWDFGDGSTSDLTSPTHQYVLPGQYGVKLTATSAEGSIDQIEKVISIYSEPNASFVVESACDQQPVNFFNQSSIAEGVLTYQWTLEQDTEVVEENPIYTYPSSGAKSVLLTATSANGCIDSVRQSVTVNPLPQPIFSVDTVCFGLVSTISNDATIATGEVVSYQWDFGDGTNSIVSAPSKTYDAAGEYPIVMRAESDLGCIASETVIARVIAAPVADFETDAACFQQSSLFSNKSSVEEGILSYQWDFGDGESSTAPEPTYAYALPGNYQATLVVSSDFGCAAQIIKTVVVNELPSVAVVDVPIANPGIPVELSASGARDYFWEPSIGLSNELISNPVATIDNTQTYQVIGTDENGCSDIAEITVTIVDDFIVIPTNTFSPDGNGINDTWFIDNIVSYDNAQVSIFNLWGEIVYESENYQNEWDGMFNNDILPAGNYYYVISNPNYSRVYKGTITLLRAR